MGRLRGQNYGLFVTLIIAILACACMCVPGSVPANAESQNRSAYVAINAGTGEIIEEMNADARLPIASTTKIMTALLAIEHCIPDEKVTVPFDATGIEGSSIYLRAGEVLTVQDLLYGLMLRSGNDSAAALAIHVAGSVENFVSMMNLRAEFLGMTNTHFVNPHGLHDDNHFSSARDMGILSVAAMKNPMFKTIVSTKKIRIGEGESTRYIANKNKMLTEFEGGNGIKTGFTKKAGRCLVSSAERNGITAIAVVLNIPDMWGVSKTLLNKVFES